MKFQFKFGDKVKCNKKIEECHKEIFRDENTVIYDRYRFVDCDDVGFVVGKSVRWKKKANSTKIEPFTVVKIATGMNKYVFVPVELLTLIEE